MLHQKVESALRNLYALGKYINHEVVSYQSDIQPDTYYTFLLHPNFRSTMNAFVNSYGQLNYYDCINHLPSADVGLVFITYNTGIGSVIFNGGRSYDSFAGLSDYKIYGIVDIEDAVKRILLSNNVQSSWAGSVSYSTPVASRCDCGGHKVGYKDNELFGHAHWCKLVTKNTSM